MDLGRNLPEYENPPVIEVVCGVLFKPLDKLFAPHLGVLWDKFKPDYPRCQEVAPLEPVIEHFEERPPQEFRFSETPPLPRIWFVHVDDTGVIQVQRDRFLHNWRKRRPEENYPRYHRVIELFRDRFSKFQAFTAEVELGTIEPLQYEMTYINHIPQSEGWTSLADFGKVFPDFIWRSDASRFLTTPEALNLRATFLLPDHAGRLHSTIRQAVRRQDGKPILVFELMVRGIGQDKSQDAMWAWFDLAREWIVKGFSDFTSGEVQRGIWRRLQ